MSTPRRRSSPAPPARWASRSTTDNQPRGRARRWPVDHDLQPQPILRRQLKENTMQRSKSYRKVAELIDRDRLYSPTEATALAKQTAVGKADSTVEVAMV